MSSTPLPPLDAVQVILARHGQTAWNVERRFLGRTDVPLDGLGRAQAARLGERLRPLAPLPVYASPLLRARETAETVAPAVPVPDLAEMDMGELEGLSGPECLARFPEVLAHWRADPSTTRIPGGETLAQLQARAVPAFRALVAAHAPGERLLVVTHQLTLATILCALAGRPLSDFRAWSHRNAALSVVHLRGADAEVVRLDDADHLEGLVG